MDLDETNLFPFIITWNGSEREISTMFIKLAPSFSIQKISTYRGIHFVALTFFLERERECDVIYKDTNDSSPSRNKRNVVLIVS